MLGSAEVSRYLDDSRGDPQAIGAAWTTPASRLTWAEEVLSACVSPSAYLTLD